METVVRGVAIYGVLLVLFQITGKRALSQVTTFDLVLLLVIANATQQGLSGEDYSLTTALVLVVTLVTMEIVLGRLREAWPRFDDLLEAPPLIVVNKGEVLKERIEKSGLTEADILEAARQLRGLERMEEIKYAVLERNGEISVIPWR